MKLNLLFGLLILTQTLFAQTFTEVIVVPEFSGVFNSSMAFSDVNGDGAEDVLIIGNNTSFDPTTKLYLNDGSGKFTEMLDTPFEDLRKGSIAFSDVNGDGFEDVLLTGETIPFSLNAKLYTNDGSGNFTEMQDTPFTGVRYSSIAFSDANGDGIEDVLITGEENSTISTKLYTNDGLGNFTEMMDIPMEDIYRSSIAFSDVNGDGNKDLLLTGQNSSEIYISKLFLYDSDSLGNFTEVPNVPFNGVRWGAVAFSDVNGDGFEDVLISGQGPLGNGITNLYTNDGAGNFTEMSNTPFQGVLHSTVAFSDLNGDGFEDVFLTGRNTSFDEFANLYINDGLGNFTEMQGTLFDPVSSGATAFSDVNGDGSLDILITGENAANERIAKLYTNDGAGNFTDRSITPFDGVYRSSIAFSDVNGDGAEDVLIAGSKTSFGNQRIAKLYLNNGSGGFVAKAGNPFDGIWFGSVAFADVNGDGADDVLITGESDSGKSAKLYLNDGLGNFTEKINTPFAEVGNSSIAFSDVNGDGSQDVLITGEIVPFPKITKLYINDGLGNFTEKTTGVPFDGVHNGAIAFSDVNGDGTNDVIITGLNDDLEIITKLYVNNGTGNFTQWMITPFIGVWSSSVAFSDVNGDGAEDVLIAGLADFEGVNTKLYINNGFGNFTEMEDTPFDNVIDGSIDFADVDGDGSQDVLITGWNDNGDNISKLYTNDGAGNFTELADTPFDGVADSSAAFSDVDGDGKMDVLITGENESDENIAKLYMNNLLVSSTEVLTIKADLDFTLFPNPAKVNNLNITYEAPAFEFITIKLFDLNGRLLRTQSVLSVIGEQTFSIDITALPTGSYFVQLDNGKKQGTAKFMVQ